MERKNHLPLLAFLGYLLFTFAGAALFAPLAHALVSEHWGFPFHRTVNRCLMVCGLLGIFIFWRGFQLTWQDLRLPRPRWNSLGTGFGFGIASLVLVTIVVMAAGGRTWETPPRFWTAAGFLAGAAAIGLAEELLFRGWLLALLTRQLGLWRGVIAGLVVFTLLHFLKVPAEFQPAVIEWHSGFQAIALAWEPVWLGIWWSWHGLALLLVGSVLSLQVLKDGHLWGAIGLHAGWVFSMRTIHDSTTAIQFSSWNAPLNQHPLTCLLLLVWCVILFRQLGSLRTPRV